MEHTAFSIYFETLVLKKELNYMKESLQDLVAHEVGPGTMITPEDVMAFFGRNGVSAQSHRLVEDFGQVVQKVASGHLIIFFNQWDKALCYKATDIESRQVTESVTEPVVKGPRESTVEQIDKNIGMLRLRLKSPRFKIETLNVLAIPCYRGGCAEKDADYPWWMYRTFSRNRKASTGWGIPTCRL